MTAPVPFEAFSRELLPGETIQWTGRPNPSVILHQKDWLMIPFGLMWGGFALFWTMEASGIWDKWVNKPDATFQLFGVVWGIPFVLVGQYMIWGRFVFDQWKKRRTFYALTNRRALILASGWASQTSSSAYFETLQMIDKRVRLDGIGTISFGGPVTNSWVSGRGAPPPPPSFEDVDDAETVYRTADRLRDQARAPRHV